MAMTSQGSTHGRFTRAVKRGHLLAAETAARELGALFFSDALALCLLYQREGDPKFEPAFRRHRPGGARGSVPGARPARTGIGHHETTSAYVR
jgi:hypothetical protein